MNRRPDEPASTAVLHESELYGMPGHLIRRCHQISLGLFHDELEAFSLTPVQFAILRHLYELGTMDQVTLAGYAAVNHVTMGEVARRLESRALLRREVNPADRRARLLRLTDAGRRLVETVMPAVHRVQDRLLAPLDTHEKAQVIALLQRVADGNNEMSRAPLNNRPAPPRAAKAKRGQRDR